MIAACGLQSKQTDSHVKDLEPIGVGQKPVAVKGEVVRLREPILLPNGQMEVVLPGNLGCKIVARSIDNIHDRALSTEAAYSIAGWNHNDDHQTSVALLNADSTEADFYLACKPLQGCYTTEEWVIQFTAHFFQFERFPNYNPGENTTPNPTPNPSPSPNPIQDTSTGRLSEGHYTESKFGCYADVSYSISPYLPPSVPPALYIYVAGNYLGGVDCGRIGHINFGCDSVGEHCTGNIGGDVRGITISSTRSFTIGRHLHFHK